MLQVAKGCGLNTGSVVSSVQLMTVLQVLVWLQPSTAVQVRVRVCAQPFVTSCWLHVNVVPQSATAPIPKLQSGMFVGLQPRFCVGAGQLVNTGPVLSSTQMVWLHD